jgi:preprotein translocase subunit SecE
LCAAGWDAQALLNTVLVIAIVGGSSLLVFGMNTLLAELAKAFYTT